MTKALRWASRGLAEPLPALGVHAVVWRYGSVFDLASLGGKTNNAATVINNAGEIVGQSQTCPATSTPPANALTFPGHGRFSGKMAR